MSLVRLNDSSVEPSHRRSDVHAFAKDHRAYSRWDDVTNHVLKRMSILSCDKGGTTMLVVYLVNCGIDEGSVEEPVAHVERKVLTDCAEDDL